MGLTLVLTMACANFELAMKLRDMPGLHFNPTTFMPFPSVGPYGTQNERPLDRKSVMLYSTAESEDVLFWKDLNDETKEYPILANHYPSNGDVAVVKAMYPDHEPPGGYHWDGDQIVKDEPQAAQSRNRPPAVPPKPSSLQASKARPSLAPKPTARQGGSSTTEPLSQILHDAFATTGQTSPTDMATILDVVEN